MRGRYLAHLWRYNVLLATFHLLLFHRVSAELNRIKLRQLLQKLRVFKSFYASSAQGVADRHRRVLKYGSWNKVSLEKKTYCKNFQN